jgi:hypothetical protein
MLMLLLHTPNDIEPLLQPMLLQIELDLAQERRRVALEKAELEKKRKLEVLCCQVPAYTLSHLGCRRKQR